MTTLTFVAVVVCALALADSLNERFDRVDHAIATACQPHHTPRAEARHRP